MDSRPGPRRRRAHGPAALLVALALVTGCSASPPPPAGAAAPAEAGSGADASRSRAAELQAGLTHLLVERAYATAAARSARDEAQRSDALTALDQVAVALADLLGATYTGAREPLLDALRIGDRRAVEQVGAARQGEPVAGQALVELQAAQAALATVVRRVVPQLGAEEVAGRLDGDLDALLAVRGDDPYALLREAAGRAVGTARLLSGGIAADRDLGPAGTGAAVLRAQLTGLLTEHVVLAGAVGREEPADPRHASAARALEANGRALGELLGTAYPALPAEFGPSWARHVARVVALARDASPELRRAVPGYSPELGAVLGRHVSGLPTRTTATEADPLLTELVLAVEAGDGADAHVALRRAAATVPALTALLAAAISEDRGYA